MRLDREGIDKMDEVEIQKQLLINSVESKESLNGIRRILNFYLVLTIISFVIIIFGSILGGI